MKTIILVCVVIGVAMGQTWQNNDSRQEYNRNSETTEPQNNQESNEQGPINQQWPSQNRQQGHSRHHQEHQEPSRRPEPQQSQHQQSWNHNSRWTGPIAFPPGHEGVFAAHPTNAPQVRERTNDGDVHPGYGRSIVPNGHGASWQVNAAPSWPFGHVHHIPPVARFGAVPHIPPHY